MPLRSPRAGRHPVPGHDTRPGAVRRGLFRTRVCTVLRVYNMPSFGTAFGRFAGVLLWHLCSCVLPVCRAHYALVHATLAAGGLAIRKVSVAPMFLYKRVAMHALFRLFVVRQCASSTTSGTVLDCCGTRPAPI